MSPRTLLPTIGLLAACASSEPPPPPAAPAPAAPVADEAGAHKAAEVALASLAKRKYKVDGCTPAETKIVSEAETATISIVNERCMVWVARRADGTWLVAIRSPVQLGNVSAAVTVSRGGEGVTHIDYKPEGAKTP
jgi:hypothetical protein